MANEQLSKHMIGNALTLTDLLAAGKTELAREKTKLKLKKPAFDINTLARQIEAELLWKSVNLLTLFNEQHCVNCGHVNTALQGIMVEQIHSREGGARRMLRSVGNHPDLPHRRESWVERVTCCSECYTDESPLPTITPLPLIERSADEDLV